MDAMISASICRGGWGRYARYCTLWELNPFSYVTLGMWIYDSSAGRGGEPCLISEIEVIDDIIDVAMMSR